MIHKPHVKLPRPSRRKALVELSGADLNRLLAALAFFEFDTSLPKGRALQAHATRLRRRLEEHDHRIDPSYDGWVGSREAPVERELRAARKLLGAAERLHKCLVGIGPLTEDEIEEPYRNALHGAAYEYRLVAGMRKRKDGAS